MLFASRCPGRHLATRQMTAASCLTSLGVLCDQLTFSLAWYRQHSAELLQPLDLACGTLFRSSCAVQTPPTDFRWQLKGHLFREAWTRRYVTSDMRRLRKNTYLLYLDMLMQWYRHKSDSGWRRLTKSDSGRWRVTKSDSGQRRVTVVDVDMALSVCCCV